MNGKSLSPHIEKLNQLKQILPEAFTEDKIDWEKLRIALGENINFANERYVLNWAGKSDAFRVMQRPSTRTLVPMEEESVNFNDTQNIFIEGENLEVLKVLQKSYFGKVKMIYIDPPYNTGNDSFIYPDRFAETKEEYQKRVGDKDEEGYMTGEGMFRKNSRENGQYHSNWLNMMMPRLYLARTLLRDDGVIFVSIDDNEVHNLRLLMNEIFGEENFVAEFPRITKKAGKTTELVAKNNDYILCFRKSEITEFYQEKHTDDGYRHSDEYEDDRGKFKLSQTLDYGSIQYSPSLDYEIFIDGKLFIPGNVSKEEMLDRQKRNPSSDFCWRWSRDLFDFGLENGFVVVKGNRIYTKTYQNAQIGKDKNGYIVEIKERTKSLSSIEFIENKYSNDNSRKDIGRIFDEKIFEYSKPINLIKTIAKATTKDNDIILDFFAGSATTAHAVMQLNKEDGGNRKYILVQMPELCDEKSEAYKAGYRTIADIAKERIRRAGKKIQDEIAEENKKKKEKLDFEENAENSKLDTGFKVFKLSESNFKQWQQPENYSAEALAEQLKLFIDPVAENADLHNMVYELLLKSGKDLNAEIANHNGYYLIDGNDLALVLEKVDEQIIADVLAKQPKKVIALDRIFKNNDQLKTNTALQMKDAGVEFKTI
jgi:adenine specific DNA methylase Mod